MGEFRCTICSQTFSFKHNLHRHERIFHNIITYPKQYGYGDEYEEVTDVIKRLRKKKPTETQHWDKIKDSEDSEKENSEEGENEVSEEEEDDDEEEEEPIEEMNDRIIKIRHVEK